MGSGIAVAGTAVGSGIAVAAGAAVAAAAGSAAGAAGAAHAARIMAPPPRAVAFTKSRLLTVFFDMY